MKYDMDMIQKITLFEKVTGAEVKDAFYFRDMMTFVVNPGMMGKALGKNKGNVRKISGLLKEKVKIVEYDEDKLKFIVNFLNPLQIQDISEVEGVVTIRGGDMKVNGLIIGVRAQNLRKLEEIVKKYFELNEIKVV